MHRTLATTVRWLARKTGIYRKHNAPGKATLQLWAALRDLNSRMIDAPTEPVFPLVKATHDHLRLRGKVSRNYIGSVTPLLCKQGEFTHLLAWRDVAFLANPGDKRNAWKLSLALAHHAETGKAVEAAELMAELAGRINDGWLNTECLHYANQQIQRHEAEGQVKADAAERYRHNFLKLLDAFQGGWTSRLHDLELIRATLTLLAGPVRSPRQDRRALAAAAIRHYGLCPGFWREYETIHTDSFSVAAKEDVAAEGGAENDAVPEALLQIAHGHWQIIQAALEDAATHLASHWLRLQPALEWFHVHLNPEAIMYMRDIAARLKASQLENDRLLADKLITRICDIEPLEVRRWRTPAAIWPTYQPPADGLNNNLLILRTAPGKADALLQQRLLVVSVVRNEMILLPHFLNHYRKLGIRAFVFVDNGSDDGTAQFLLDQLDVVLYTTDTEYKHGCYGVAWQQAVLGNHCLGKWVLLADADEFLVYPEWERRTLPEFLSGVEAKGGDVVLTPMIDMYPPGSLDAADFGRSEPFQAAPYHDAKPLIEWRLGSGQFSNGVNYLSALRHRLSNDASPNAFTSQKLALVRYQPWIRYSAGLHHAANVRLVDEMAAFAHFKYHAGFRQKVLNETQRAQHYNNAEEYWRYLAMLNAVNTGFASEEASVKYNNWILDSQADQS
jgi:glycosyltransferase involved in cell wall biosynthesis